MHYHLEILMPPAADVAGSVEKIMAPFDENAEDRSHAFWDWYQIGGRYSGSKIEALAGEDHLKAFREAISALGVTVSGLIWGKNELSPASQIPAVDALWREMCPGAGDICPLFKHSGDEMTMDVCRLDELPTGLKAYAFIHAADGLEAKTMLHKSIWNGVTHQDTNWCGSVSDAIEQTIKRCDRYKDEYKAKIMPQPDWLVVTVDYHS